jgi:splicing factor 3A subunit 3
MPRYAVLWHCSYWGRRAFERHFKEWRHVNGMKALGIPNNKDFFEVTQIADAQSLWKTIQVSLAGRMDGKSETPHNLETLSAAEGQHWPVQPC